MDVQGQTNTIKYNLILATNVFYFFSAGNSCLTIQLIAQRRRLPVNSFVGPDRTQSTFLDMHSPTQTAAVRKMESLACVPGSNTVWYIPNFVTEEEEEYLIRKIKDTPHQRWKTLGNRRRLQIWGGEILQNGILFAQPLPPFLKIFPNIISRLKLTGAFTTSPHKEPNHVILNEYLPGQGIMPHEDGPIYHPAVATISLGSHTILHYYQYAKEPGLTGNTASPSGEGRAVSSIPVMSILLERRSLIITTDEMYSSRLHGIEGTDSDEISQGGLVRLSTGTVYEIANRDLLTDEGVLQVVRHGGSLNRTVRYSLTCRDVCRVARKAAD